MYDDDKLYFIKDKQRISLSNEKEKGKLWSLSTIHGKNNVKFIRVDLGITEYVTASKKSRAASLDEINPETTPAQDLSKTTAYVHEIIETISQETQTDIQYIRELGGLDKAMQTIVGARNLNTAKMIELKEEKEQKSNELRLARLREDTPQEIDKLEKEIIDIDDNLKERKTFGSELDRINRSQLTRIKETISKFKEDKTLGERINTIFREQCITVSVYLRRLV